MRGLKPKPKPSEAEIAAAAAKQARADQAAPREAQGFEDGRDPETGAPAPGAVRAVTRSVETAYEEESSEWLAFRNRVERSGESPRAAQEALELLERQIERRRLNIKHAPSPLDRRRAEARLERLDRQHSELFASLHDVHIAGEPILRGWPCRKCGDEFPDRAARWSHALTCRPTY